MMIWEMAQTGDHSMLRRPLTIRDMVYLRVCRSQIEKDKSDLRNEYVKLFSGSVDVLSTILADMRKILFDSQLHFESPGQAELYRITLPSSRGREQEIKDRLIIGRSRGGVIRKEEQEQNDKMTSPDKD